VIIITLPSHLSDNKEMAIYNRLCWLVAYHPEYLGLEFEIRREPVSLMRVEGAPTNLLEHIIVTTNNLINKL
jgi:hypothetical protein